MASPKFHSAFVDGLLQQGEEKGLEKGAVKSKVEDLIKVIRARGLGEIPSHEVGLAILGPLRDLDEVAYLRFASVYRGFESLTDFEDEISALRTARQEAGVLTPPA